MSVFRWRFTEACDSLICCGNCDECEYEFDDECEDCKIEIEEDNDGEVQSEN